MIKNFKKKFDGIQEETRQNRAEREMERKRTKALEELVGEEKDKWEAILKEFLERRKRRG